MTRDELAEYAKQLMALSAQIADIEIKIGIITKKILEAYENVDELLDKY